MFESVTMIPVERGSGTSPLVVDRNAGILVSVILMAVAFVKSTHPGSAADAEAQAATATPSINASFIGPWINSDFQKPD